MQGHGDNIIWNMFEPYSKEWVDQLMEVWSRKLGFSLPSWDLWEKIPDVSEAYR